MSLNWVIICSVNGLLPFLSQVIIWINAELLPYYQLDSIKHNQSNINEIWIKINQFSFKKIDLNILTAKWWPSCLSLNELISPALLLVGHSTKIHIIAFLFGKTAWLAVSQLRRQLMQTGLSCDVLLMLAWCQRHSEIIPSRVQGHPHEQQTTFLWVSVRKT